MARKRVATVYLDGTAYPPGAYMSPEQLERVTNDAAFAEVADDQDTGPSSTADERSELESMSKADLVALAEARDVDASGTKAELVHRLSQG